MKGLKITSVDLTGPFVCSWEAVKQMQKQQNPEGGSIINISSVHRAFQNHIMFLMLLQRRISK
jgi:NAD(P)-dependent dehydrogenase (short-subunit alcohol dehydrogenase family)